jgi:PPOX class probable F420-dependent enzyme
VNEAEARRRLAEARVGRMATATAEGVPHVVPFVFALSGDTIYWAVDQKPKRSRRLKRLDNIEANPRAEALVDHYTDDWDRVWWVRAAGDARIVDGEPERTRALTLLEEKYPQYADQAPAGPVVAIDVRRWTFWDASGVGHRSG